MSTSYTAFLLPSDVRQALIDRFPPAYPLIKAHHITHRHGVKDFGDLFHPKTVEITGIADDGNGLQALIVKVNGGQLQPDGRPYHITWSLDPAVKLPEGYSGKGTYRPVHSNDLVKRILTGERLPGDSFTAFDPPLKITVTPALVEKNPQGHATVRPLPPAPGDNPPPPSPPR